MDKIEHIYERFRNKAYEIGRPEERARAEVMINTIKQLRLSHACLMKLSKQKAQEKQLQALAICYQQGELRMLCRGYFFEHTDKNGNVRLTSYKYINE